MRRRLTTICCVLFAVSVTSCASRPFRVHPGVAAPGQALTPLALFPSRLAWSAPLGDTVPRGLPGLGGDRVYLSLDGTTVLATDARSGATLWRSVVPSGFTPVESGRLVLVGADADVRGLEIEGGTTVWTQSLPRPMATAPVAESGWLIVTCVGRLVALRASDGAILWEREVGLTTQSPPTVNGSRVFVPTMTGVVALDLESGVQIWTRRLGGPASEILATPDRIYVGSEDKHFYAIETATGAVSWRWRTGGRVYGRPVVDAARVYFVSSDNILRGLDRWSGAQRWKRVLPFRPIAGPVAMGQALLVAGTGATLFAYGARDGAPAGEIAVGGELFSPPYPLDTALPTILVGTHDLSKGVGLAAFTRSIEPRVLPMAPLPNATPVPSLGAVGAAERPEAGVDAVAATAAR